MSVHVGEIHTDLSGAGSSGGEHAGGDTAKATYPGARQDEWRAARDEFLRLRHRVCAEGFDD